MQRLAVRYGVDILVDAFSRCRAVSLAGRAARFGKRTHRPICQRHAHSKLCVWPLDFYLYGSRSGAGHSHLSLPHPLVAQYHDGMFPEDRYPMEVFAALLHDEEKIRRILKQLKEPDVAAPSEHAARG